MAIIRKLKIGNTKILIDDLCIIKAKNEKHWTGSLDKLKKTMYNFIK